MIDLPLYLAKFVAFEISFLIAEIVILLVLDIENRKFRWDYEYKSARKITLTFLLLVFIIIPFLDTFLWNFGINFLINNIKFYLLSLSIILFCIIYLWTTKFIIGVKLNKSDLIPASIILLVSLLTFVAKKFFS